MGKDISAPEKELPSVRPSDRSRIAAHLANTTQYVVEGFGSKGEGVRMAWVSNTNPPEILAQGQGGTKHGDAFFACSHYRFHGKDAISFFGYGRAFRILDHNPTIDEIGGPFNTCTKDDVINDLVACEWHLERTDRYDTVVCFVGWGKTIAQLHTSPLGAWLTFAGITWTGDDLQEIVDRMLAIVSPTIRESIGEVIRKLPIGQPLPKETIPA